jgi:hypothetical protein
MKPPGFCPLQHGKTRPEAGAFFFQFRAGTQFNVGGRGANTLKVIPSEFALPAKVEM